MNEPRKIYGYSSVLLDSLRIAAALTVLAFHIYGRWFHPIGPYLLENVAHSAVIVFFVLSGFVIAYTTNINNRGGVQYMQARFSRLYSIVIPALVVTAFCEFLVSRIDPSLHDYFTRGASLPRYVLSGLFLNEIWLFSSAPPINAPLWSLSFEFWYYIIFGLWFYRRKTGWKSFIFPVLGCLIAGPKILLMMPIWLTGYFAYHLPQIKIKRSLSWILIFCSLIAAALIVLYVRPTPAPVGTPPLYFAGQFLTDWLIGLFVGGALWLVPAYKNEPGRLNWTKSLRAVADITFPLYVLHNPLMVLWDALFGKKIVRIDQLWQPFFTVLIVACLIGILLEKQRFIWSNLFKFLFSGFSRKQSKSA